MKITRHDICCTFRILCETERIFQSGHPKHNGRVSSKQDLRFVDGTEGLKDAIDGQWMDSILRFFQNVNLIRPGQVSRKGQGQQSERTVGCHPRWDFDTRLVAESQIGVAVIFALDNANVFQFGERRLNML